MGVASIVIGMREHTGQILLALAAQQSSTVLWYLTRATAIAAYVALALATICGMLRGIARGAGERLSWVVDELHQVLATSFAGLVVLHLVTLYYHTFIPFSLSNFLWPGSQPYRPFAVNLGVLALYTLVLVLVSTWFRRFIPYRFWRRIHYLSFATLVLVTVHGLLAGSDSGEPWMHALYAGVSAAVGFVLLMRVLPWLRGLGAKIAHARERSLAERAERLQLGTGDASFPDEEAVEEPMPPFPRRWSPTNR